MTIAANKDDLTVSATDHPEHHNALANAVNALSVMQFVATDVAYGAVGDARYVADGVTTNASTTVTSATAAFTSADVGKALIVRGAGAAGADLVTTVASFTNSTTIVAGAAAGANTTARELVVGTNNTTAITAAMTAAAAVRGNVVIPPSAYGYLCAGQLTIPEGVTLAGTNQAPAAGSYLMGTNAYRGCELWTTGNRGVTTTSLAFITLSNGSTVSGLSIFYPLQTATNPPQSYPPTITGTTLVHRPAIVNMLLVNPYIGIYFDQTDKVWIDGVFGQPLNTGLYLDRCYDVPHVKRIHWWPYWQFTEFDDLDDYIKANLTGFKLGRIDGLLADDWFVINAKRGIHCFTAVDGYHAYGSIDNLYIDFADIGVQGDFGVVVPSPLTLSGQIFANGATGPAIRVTSGYGGFRVCATLVTTGPATVDITSGAGYTLVALIGCTLFWGSGGSDAAINVASTQAGVIASGCAFRTGTGYQLDTSALTASDIEPITMVGNQFSGSRRFLFNVSPKVIDEAANTDGASGLVSGRARFLGDIDATGGYRQTIDGFYAENPTGTAGPTALTRLATTTDNPNAWIAPRAGSITAVTVHSNAARSTGTLTATVRKNATPIALTAVLDGTNTTFKTTTSTKDTLTFAAGDLLDVTWTTSSWTPTTADIRASVEVET